MAGRLSRGGFGSFGGGRGFGGVGAQRFSIFGFRSKKGLGFKSYAATSVIKTRDVMKKAVVLVEAEAKRLITSGYYRPAVDTGRLRLSVNGQVVNNSPPILEGKVGTSVYYGIYVHEGTKFMQKRPFLVDALRNKQPIINEMFRLAYRGVF